MHLKGINNVLGAVVVVLVW